MAIKIILILSALIMVGCSVFPSTTSISANSKLDKVDNPTIKVQQDFKWSRD
jgi:PBP1b-binding outer membrane lipoprotein LpoB